MQYENDKLGATLNNQLSELNDLFQVVAGRYKTALRANYLNDSSITTKQNVERVKEHLDRIVVNTTEFSKKINTAILENNQQIQTLDEYIAGLKNKTNVENSTLSKVQNSGDASIPRKKYIRSIMQGDYYMDAFYFVAILGSLYYFNSLRSADKN